MIKDLDRGIVAIRYNSLNLPDTIQFINGNQVLNTYDAMGVKLKTEYISSTSAHVVPVGQTVQTTRSNYTRTGSISTSYQPYKYTGMEFIETYGYDSYDYHARWRMAAIPVFETADPLAKKYYSINPYVYCNNNPVRYIDPTGMDVYLLREDGTVVLALKDDEEEDRLFSAHNTENNYMRVNYIIRQDEFCQCIFIIHILKVSINIPHGVVLTKNGKIYNLD